MPPTLAIPLFVVSLAVTLVAARMFARRLDRLGVALGLPEALVGLLTALAADGPEISSALVALAKGEHGGGVGGGGGVKRVQPRRDGRGQRAAGGRGGAAAGGAGDRGDDGGGRDAARRGG